MSWINIKPILDMQFKTICKRAYPGHKKGCPNYGKKIGCPPHPFWLADVMDFRKEVFAIYNIFDLKAHVERMKLKHPYWSVRQLHCCLYWQGSARKMLKEVIICFKIFYKQPDYLYFNCPESLGMNVTQTMKNVGINLEWPPKDKVYQIAIAGIRK